MSSKRFFMQTLLKDKHEPRDVPSILTCASPPYSIIYRLALTTHQAHQTSNRSFSTPQSTMAQNPETQHNLAYQMVQASTALTFGGSLSVLSGLTLTAAIICLTAVTPLLVIFSPVLVPAAIAMLLLATGFFSSGGLGVTAAFVFYWLHNYVAGKHPVGADRLDQLAAKLARGASRTEQRSPVSAS